MNIIVCIKQVPDPEAPSEYFEINAEANRVEPRGIPPVLSLFDENALEAALRLKDSIGGNAGITVLSMGKKISTLVMSKALAAGAEKLVKVEDNALDSDKLDSYLTAVALASAIRKLGTYDLIVVGRQAADWNCGQVGIGIAEFLRLPVVTLARKLDIVGGSVHVERIVDDGYEVVRSRLPSVVVASNEVGMLRYPTLIQRRDAKKKPVTTWNADDIGFDRSLTNRVVLRRLFTPDIKKRSCEIIGGTSPEEMGWNLATRLVDGRLA